MKRDTILLTPALAEQFLKHNDPRNRKISKTTVMTYAEAINRGKWNPYASEFDPIVVSTEGLLMNGQHRCAAVVKTQLSVSSCIVYDVPSDMFQMFDGGLSRSASQFVPEKNANTKTALALTMTAIKYGSSPLASSVLGKIGTAESMTYTVPRTMVIEEYENNKELINHLIARAEQIRRMTKFAITACATALFIIKFTHRDYFLEDFCDEFTKTLPSSSACSKLVRFCFNSDKKKIKLNRCSQIACLLYAYDAFKDGTEIKAFNKYMSAISKYDKLVKDAREKLKED